MISGMITLGFIGLVVFLGKYLFSVGDWGKPVKRPRKPIGKVRMGEYRKFHERHGGPATVAPPVPRE